MTNLKTYMQSKLLDETKMSEKGIKYTDILPDKSILRADGVQDLDFVQETERIKEQRYKSNVQ